jgi:transposase InsO family protein
MVIARSIVTFVTWGEVCGKHLVAKLMRREGLRSQTGYQRRKGHYGGKSPQAAPNMLARQFKTSAPNISWVTDITYIRTQEGWLYLAVVLDLFSRQIVGWAMKPRMMADLAVDGGLAAQAKAAGAGAFGSGQPVYRWGMAGLSKGSQPELLYEPTWQLSRQRCRRELLSVAQTGADQAQDLLDKRRSPQRRI